MNSFVVKFSKEECGCVHCNILKNLIILPANHLYLHTTHHPKNPSLRSSKNALPSHSSKGGKVLCSDVLYSSPIAIVQMDEFLSFFKEVVFYNILMSSSFSITAMK